MISMASVHVDEETIQAVVNVLRSGQIAQGPKVEEFEKAFAAYCGTKYAVAVNSGTAALHAGLIAAGIHKGDEVITTSFSFIATANCCQFFGAVPVFADVDEKTFNITADSIEKKITSKTRAVIIVDLYGQSCEMDAITALCKKHNLVLIEDACQSHGATFKGQKVGSFGVGCFSFYPTKNMTTGEGGMITTNDEEIQKNAMLFRQHGQAIGLRQLEQLDKANARRNHNASFLTKHISSIKGLIPPFVAPNCHHVFHQYTIKITSGYKYTREELQQKLLAKGVSTIIYYPTPIHQQPYYKKLGFTDKLSITESVAKQVLSLPVHPGVSEADLNTIVDALKAV
jgi:perosamine synthetase